MNNIYIARNGTYPESAIEEVSRDDLSVKFCNMGGGFVKSLTLEDFDTIFTPHKDNEPDYKEIRAGIDGSEGELGYKAYTRGYLWNGWTTPCFEYDQVVEVIKDGALLAYDKETDTFTDTFDNEMDEDPETYIGFDILINDKPVHVYAIGSGSWCWYVINKV
ncbi:MAG: hypothetical protein DRG09_04735 [Epsilonproteobacteria bacterium]|nr:MAG: hypothetical protein DRG09_04735 [Campylobacterota bacterium]